MSLSFPTEETSHDEMLSEINTTPLIDVLLVLLVMLMITLPVPDPLASFSLRRSQAPQSEPLASPPLPTEDVSPRPVYRLSLSAQGDLFWQGEPLPWPELATRLAQIPHEPQAVDLWIAPAADCSWEHVLELLASVQRLGFCDVSLSPLAPSPD